MNIKRDSELRAGIGMGVSSTRGGGMSQLDARRYGSRISETERAVLREQVHMVESDVVMWREAPVTTVFQIDDYAEKMREITRGIERLYMVVDLTGTGRPSEEVISRLRVVFASLPSLEHSVIFSVKNFMLNVAAKFVLARLGFFSFSMHSTEQ